MKRYRDKLIAELAKGKEMKKVCERRSSGEVFLWNNYLVTVDSRKKSKEETL